MTATERALPVVSVVVPTRDRPDMLRRALDSILGQDYEGEIQVILVFDQAEAELFEAPSLPNRMVQVLTNSRTPGLAGARNTGIEASSGELIAHCDDDDEWLPSKLTVQVSRWQRRQGPIAAVSGGLVIAYGRHRRVRLPARSELTHTDFLESRHLAIHSSTLLVPRQVYQAVGLIDEDMPESYAEDYEWLLRCTRYGPVLCRMEPVVTVYWDRPSWFAERWKGMVLAYTALIEKHPDLLIDRRNGARIYGQLAFASAAAGQRRNSLRWAGRAIARRPVEVRPYLAALIATGLLRPTTVLRLAQRFGRGV